MNPVSAAAATAAATAVSAKLRGSLPAARTAPSLALRRAGRFRQLRQLLPRALRPGRRRGETEAGFVRGLMIGFSKPFAGETVSLYVDAEPSGAPVELDADILRGGRFVPADLVTDTSYGLTESGILTLALPGPPDYERPVRGERALAAAAAQAAGAAWAPRLRGLHLNAVLAGSVETHAMEQLGQSIGVADQLFQLTEPPVDPRRWSCGCASCWPTRTETTGAGRRDLRFGAGGRMGALAGDRGSGGERRAAARLRPRRAGGGSASAMARPGESRRSARTFSRSVMPM